MKALLGWFQWQDLKYLPQSSQSTLVVYIALLALGWLMVTSASMAVSESTYGDPFHLSTRQAVYALLCIPATMIGIILPMKFWQHTNGFLLLVTFALLIAILIPGVGHIVKGSARWLNFGFFNVQPSEIAKLTVVLYIAGYLVRRQEEVRTSWKGFAKPLIVLFITTLLLLLEPDFGASVVLVGAVLTMLFVGGVKLWQFILLCVAFSAAAVFVAMLEPYRVERLIAFTNPWATENVYGGGYQLTQSLIAFGRGELFGTGLGQSMQKLFYLPEAHTDFVFAIWAEETGLLGALLIVSLLGYLVAKCLTIGKHAINQGQAFSGYIAYGLGMLIGLQILINLGVNTGLLPTKGLTLPLLSYGGSSLLITGLMVGILLRIAMEARSSEFNNPEKKVAGRNKKDSVEEVVYG